MSKEKVLGDGVPFKNTIFQGIEKVGRGVTPAREVINVCRNGGSCLTRVVAVCAGGGILLAKFLGG